MVEDLQAITVPVVASVRVNFLAVPEMFPPGAACQSPVRKCPLAVRGAAVAGPAVAATTGTVASVPVWPGLSVQARRTGAGLAVALGGLGVALGAWLAAVVAAGLEALAAGLAVLLGAGLAVALGGVVVVPSLTCGASSTDRPAAVKVRFPVARSVTGWTAPGT